MKKNRRQLQREKTIEEILAIAREEMQENGVAALSLGVIARRMGLKTPSLYHYFESKDAIYDELFKRGYLLYSRLVEERIDAKGSVAEGLTRRLTIYMTFAQENPDLYQIMFQRPVPGFTPSPESYDAALKLLAKSQAEAQKIIDSGELKLNIPSNQAVDLIIAMNHGLTEMHLANNPELPVGQGRYGQLIPAAVDLFLAAWGNK